MSEQPADRGGDWVDVAHVAARVERPLSAAQWARAAQFIRDAESILRERVPRIDERVVADTTAPLPDGGLRVSTVVRVVCQAVIRALEPGGGRVVQRQAGEGPFNESRTYLAPSSSSEERTGGVQFTRGELDDLREHDGTPDGYGSTAQSIPTWRVPSC